MTRMWVINPNTTAPSPSGWDGEFAALSAKPYTNRGADRASAHPNQCAGSIVSA